METVNRTVPAPPTVTVNATLRGVAAREQEALISFAQQSDALVTAAASRHHDIWRADRVYETRITCRPDGADLLINVAGTSYENLTPHLQNLYRTEVLATLAAFTTSPTGTIDTIARITHHSVTGHDTYDQSMETVKMARRALAQTVLATLRASLVPSDAAIAEAFTPPPVYPWLHVGEDDDF